MVARAARCGQGVGKCRALVHALSIRFRRTALGPQDASTSSPLGGLRVAGVERWRLVALALGFAGELDAIGIVNDAVEDRVGDSWPRR